MENLVVNGSKIILLLVAKLSKSEIRFSYSDEANRYSKGECNEIYCQDGIHHKGFTSSGRSGYEESR